MKRVLLTTIIVFSATALFAQAKADTAKQQPMKWVLQKNTADSNRMIQIGSDNNRMQKLFYTAPPNSPPVPQRPNTDLIDVR